MNIRVYLADQSYDFKRKIYDYFIGSDITVVGDTDDGNVAFDEIQRLQPDFVILDLWLKGTEGAELIHNIRKSMKEPPHFIIVTGIQYSSILEEAIEAGASLCISKPCDISFLAMKLYKFAHTREAKAGHCIDESYDVSLENYVTRLLHKVGIPAHIKGYKYLRTAIILTYQNNDIINSVTKALYPAIAKEYDTTSSRVERAIRHAIEIAWDRGDCDVLNEMFGYTVQKSKGKPTNSEFIALIADYLRIYYKINNHHNGKFKYCTESSLLSDDFI